MLQISPFVFAGRHSLGFAHEFHQQFGAHYSSGGLVFANPDGTPVKPDSVSASVSALCRRLKMPKGVSLHTLRHPRIVPDSGRHGDHCGVGAAWALHAPRYPRCLRARASRPRRRGGVEVGAVPEAERVHWRDRSCSMSFYGPSVVAARGSAKLASYRGIGSANGNRTRI